MATYYINSYNTSGTFPYTDRTTGAPNFKTLLDNLVGYIKDYDEIIIEPSTVDVDDSDATIEINYRLSIVGNTVTRIKLSSSGVGMNILSSGVYISNLYLDSDSYTNNNILNIKGNNVTITNSIIGSENKNGISSLINLDGCDGFRIENSRLYIPSPMNTYYSFGIYAYNSDYCKVKNNIIRMWDNNCNAIMFEGSCSHNEVSYNVMGNFDSTASDNRGIEFGINGNYNKIHHNVINLTGQVSSGIVYTVDNVSGKGVAINNNYILMRENDFGSVGIYIPYTQNNDIAEFSIVNNIIEFRGDNNDCIAINASIKSDKSVINYNNIFGFDRVRQFVNNGAPDVITRMGSKTIYVDPRPVLLEDPILLDGDIDHCNIKNYYCNVNSECVGSGYMHHNIGIDTNISHLDNNYINIVDTVTYNYDIISLKEHTINTFFNSVFTSTSDRFNKGYRAGDEPYPSDVYKNQFEFNLTRPDMFPFVVGDHFYNKDLSYVCEHKIDLRPFDGIKCPPNPGYGFPEYKNYEEGLWGYPRLGKENTCALDGCIYQDTYENYPIVQDVLEDMDIWIQDDINPECLM